MKPTTLLPFLLLALFFGTRGSAQETTDGVENIQLEVVLARLDTTWKEAPQAAVDLITAALLEVPAPAQAQFIHAAQLKGRAHRNLGDYVTAIDEWKIVYQYATEKKDSFMLVEAAKQIGGMKGYMGSYLEAQPYLLQVADIHDAIGTPSDQASAMNGLASMYKNMEREDDAVRMYHRALELYSSIDHTMGKAAINANLGLLHIERGEFELAEKHLLEQGRLHKKADSQYGLAFNYEFLGVLRQKQGRPAEGLPLAEKSLAIRRELPSHYNIAESSLTVADILLDLGRFREAADYADQVLEYRDKHQSLTQEMKAYEVLSKASEGVGNASAALNYHRSFKEISDSIYQRDHLEEIASQNARYEKAKQEEAIAQLDKEAIITKADLEFKNAALVVAGLALLGLAIVSALIWGLFRKISRQKEDLQVLHNQKDTLLREIHHRVKNNLQMVSSLLSLQSEYIEDDAALDALQMGQSRVRSMAIIHQKLYMRNESITEVSARDYLDQLIGELMATLNVSGLPLKLEKNLENIELDIDRMIPLGLIANEVITNAMKYAFEGRASGKLQVDFRLEGKRVVLDIADDGHGLVKEDANEKESFGSLLIRTFAEQLEGKLSITGQPGTRVRLEFPA